MRDNSMGYLILVRHGAPFLKPDEKLAGWMNIPLSREGLVRTQETLFIILSSQNKTGIVANEKAGDKSKIGMRKWYSHPYIFKDNFIPAYHTAALNELYYGKLPGKNKKLKKNMDPESLLPGAGILNQARLKGKVSKLSMSGLCPISCKKFCLQ
jgi:2,3-bisphosphoglycerate-dependent phosphoglycerate mutase